MKRRIRLTESDLRHIVKESVRRIMNEDYVSGYHFNDNKSQNGEFENALYNAFSLASTSNQNRLMDAFPEYFSKERMYGNEKDSFDYHDFANKDSYENYYNDWKSRNNI